MKTSGRYRVWGNPISHSMSPQVHALFAAQRGEQIDYDRGGEGMDAEQFLQAVQEFFAQEGKGCNITSPFKPVVASNFHQQTQAVALAQAANTLIKTPEGEIWAANTDGYGLVTDLMDLGWLPRGNISSVKDLAELGLVGDFPGQSSRVTRNDVTNEDPPATNSNDLNFNSKNSWETIRVLILGAGGATAGVLWDLLGVSQVQIDIYNRTQSKAEELCHRFNQELGNQEPRLKAVTSYDFNDYDLVINGVAYNSAPGDEVKLLSPALTPESKQRVKFYDMQYRQQGQTLFAQAISEQYVPLLSYRDFVKTCKSKNQVTSDSVFPNPVSQNSVTPTATFTGNYTDGLGMLVKQAVLSHMCWFKGKPWVDAQAVIEELA